MVQSHTTVIQISPTSILLIIFYFFIFFSPIRFKINVFILFNLYIFYFVFNLIVFKNDKRKQNIQKRAIKLWKHIKMSEPKSYHHKALQGQEMSTERSPLSLPVLSLSSLTDTNTTNTNQPQGSNALIQTIRPNQIMMKEKKTTSLIGTIPQKVNTSLNAIWP